MKVKDVVVAGLAVGAALVTAAPAQATYPGANGLIAYEDWGTGRSDRSFIRLIGLDGVHDPFGTFSHDPQFSPDGKRFTYIPSFQGGGLNVRDVVNDETRKLLGQDLTYPAVENWADATHVDVAGVHDPATGAFGRARIDVTTGDRAPLTAPESPGRVSPDGTRWARFRPNVPGTFTGYDLYVTDASCAEIRATNVSLTSQPRWDWSPDGTTIVFDDGGLGPIRVVAANGSTPPAPLPLPDPDNNWAPLFSPDGESIAYSHDEAPEESGESSMWVAKLDGSGGQALTVGGDNAHVPASWQPIPESGSSIPSMPEAPACDDEPGDGGDGDGEHPHPGDGSSGAGSGSGGGPASAQNADPPSQSAGSTSVIPPRITRACAARTRTLRVRDWGARRPSVKAIKTKSRRAVRITKRSSTTYRLSFRGLPPGKYKVRLRERRGGKIRTVTLTYTLC